MATKSNKKPTKKSSSKKTTTKAPVAKKATKATKKTTTKKAAVKKTTVKKKAVKKATVKKKAAVKKTTKKSATKKKAASSPSAAALRKKREQAAIAAAKAMQDIIARARDHFRTAPSEHRFNMVDGRSLRDLYELAEALDDLSHHIFSHHVNHEKHDFAAWIEHVLQERALAQQLREVQPEPAANQYVIYRHIVRRVW